MYYNPETKETLSREEVKSLFHSSFPEGTKEVFGWHLIDKSALLPSLEDGQTAVPTEIVLHEGRWCQAYRAGELPKPQEDLEARCRMLEQALVDLAQTFSDYREGKEPLTQVLQYHFAKTKYSMGVYWTPFSLHSPFQCKYCLKPLQFTIRRNIYVLQSRN